MFGIDSKFYEVVSKIADLVILNLIFVLCSLPIITIGASTTALYGVTKKDGREQRRLYFKNFFNCSRRILDSQRLCGLYY